MGFLFWSFTTICILFCLVHLWIYRNNRDEPQDDYYKAKVKGPWMRGE